MINSIFSKDNDHTVPVKTGLKAVQKQHTKKENAQSIKDNPINIEFLNSILRWLKTIIEQRCREIGSDINSQPVYTISELPEPKVASPYAEIAAQYNLNEVGHILLALSIIPHYAPEFFDFILRTQTEKGDLKPHVGGRLDRKANQFTPTYFTALFLLSGNNLELRGRYIIELQEAHPLLQEQIIYKDDLNGTITHFMSSIIELDSSFYDYFTKGIKPRLDHGQHFAATLKTMPLSKADAILESKILEDMQLVDKYAKIIESSFFDSDTHKFKKGFTALFHGKPGTGKTLMAGILANAYGLDMYHVDLSNVVSRYVGEAEKKLEIIFNRLQGKNCMLFFDEADALFGKRSEVKEAHDRYANQEVSYLLQRIETFDGLVILASNYKNNMDAAFKRRLDITVNFISPQEKSREALWNYYLPTNLKLESDALLKYLVKEYAYTGANIRNIMKNVAITMASDDKTTITFNIIKAYLKIENDKAFEPHQARVIPFNPDDYK